MTRVRWPVSSGDGQVQHVELSPAARLPRFFMDEPCAVCGNEEAECHLCPGYASHWIETERGEFYLCPAHSFLAHAWEEAGLGEWVAYAPTCDCRCDPWKYGSP